MVGRGHPSAEQDSWKLCPSLMFELPLSCVMKGGAMVCVCVGGGEEDGKLGGIVEEGTKEQVCYTRGLRSTCKHDMSWNAYPQPS